MFTITPKRSRGNSEIAAVVLVLLIVLVGFIIFKVSYDLGKNYVGLAANFSNNLTVGGEYQLVSQGLSSGINYVILIEPDGKTLRFYQLDKLLPEGEKNFKAIQIDTHGTKTLVPFKK